MAAKRNPRPIPLDHDRLTKIAEGLARTAHRNLTNWQQLEPNGMVLAQNVMKVTNVKGEERYITILLITKPRENWMDDTSGSFSKKAGKILIKIPAGPDDLKMLLDTLADPGVESGLHILRTLQHEMTHARDHYHLPKGNWELSSSKETVGKYLNMPVEVRARMQELAQLAIASIPAIKREYRRPKPPEIPPVQWVLEQMELWNRAEPLYTPKSRKQIMLGVERALRDAGLDMEGKGYLPNPRPIPLEHDKLKQASERLAKAACAFGVLGTVADGTVLAKTKVGELRIEVIARGLRKSDSSWRSGTVGGESAKLLDLVRLYVPRDLGPRLCKPEGDLASRLYLTLVHEATHVADPGGGFGSRPRKAVPYHEYFNQPREVRAFMAGVAEEILRRGDLNFLAAQKQDLAGGAFLERLLKLSNEWRDKETYLTPENRKLVLLGVERALRDAGLETEGNGSLKNPYYLQQPLTASDKRRAAPIIRRWQGSLYDDQKDYDWEKAFARLDDVFAKTRPKGPVTLFRGARDESEIGSPHEYTRFTSWTLERDLGFKYTAPGQKPGPDVVVRVHPEDIVATLGAFGDRIDRDQMSEVILRPGKYFVVKKLYMGGEQVPLSPPNTAMRNPRLVPLKHDVLQDLVGRLRTKLITWVRATSTAVHKPELMLSIDIEMVQAGRSVTREYRIVMVGAPATNTKRRFVSAGSYGDGLIQIDVMIDRVRSAFTEGGEDSTGYVKLRDELTEILAHEMTHAGEYKLTGYKFMTRPDGSVPFVKWANDPAEVRAEARLIWEQVRKDLFDWQLPIYQDEKAEGKTTKGIVEYLLEQSPEWKRLDKALTASNRAKIIKIIERELREAGVDTEGKGALRNPAPVPIDRPELRAFARALARRLAVRIPAFPSLKPGDILAEEWITVPRIGTASPAKISVFVEAAEDEKPETRFTPYVVGGRFNAQRDRILIWLDIVPIVRDFGAMASAVVKHHSLLILEKDLLHMLAHEMTHATERSLPEIKVVPEKEMTEEKLIEWGNRRHEVRAQASAFVEEILGGPKWRLESRAKYMQRRPSRTWVEWLILQTQSHFNYDRLTEKNKRQVLLIVERALRDAGVETQGEGVLRNPSSTPASKDWTVLPSRSYFHGTNDPGDLLHAGTFDPERLQKRDHGFFGHGFYLTDREEAARSYGKTVLRVTLKRETKLLLALGPSPKPMSMSPSGRPAYHERMRSDWNERVFALRKGSRSRAQIAEQFDALYDPESSEWDRLGWYKEVTNWASTTGSIDGVVWGSEVVIFNPSIIASIERIRKRNPAPSAKTLERKAGNGAYKTAFFGDDDGSWQAFGNNQWPSLRDWDWQMIPSMSSRNDWKNFSVDGATEQHTVFIRALRQITEQYPEALDFLVSFDGPYMSIRDLLAAWAEAPVPIGAMTFFHGTSGAAWESIMREGLRPRGETGQRAAYGALVDEEKAGRTDAVYLTTQATMARSAARQAARAHKSFPVVLKVTDLDPSLAEPDEDSREKTAEDSIARMGSMAYRGIINPDQIGLEWAGDEVKGGNKS